MFKKEIFRILNLFAGIVLIFTFMGCEDDGSTTSSDENGPFTIEFVTNGGNPAPVDQTVEKGKKASQPSLMTNANHEDFKGWFTNSACTTPFSFETVITKNTKLYAKWGYFVGDTGPAGGKVFYVKSGTVYPNWKYLEASPMELLNMKMVTGYYNSSGASTEASVYVIESTKQTAIGTGQANTTAFLTIENLPPFSGDPSPQTPAVRSAVNYMGGSLNDWFLPSKDELQSLLTSNVLSITLDSHYYWSSSQHSDGGRTDCAWALQFGTGDRGHWNEENKAHDRAFVRPIRSFFCSH